MWNLTVSRPNNRALRATEHCSTISNAEILVISCTGGAGPTCGPVHGESSRKPPRSRQNRYGFSKQPGDHNVAHRRPGQDLAEGLGQALKPSAGWPSCHGLRAPACEIGDRRAAQAAGRPLHSDGAGPQVLDVERDRWERRADAVDAVVLVDTSDVVGSRCATASMEAERRRASRGRSSTAETRGRGRTRSRRCGCIR